MTALLASQNPFAEFFQPAKQLQVHFVTVMTLVYVKDFLAPFAHFNQIGSMVHLCAHIVFDVAVHALVVARDPQLKQSLQEIYPFAE